MTDVNWERLWRMSGINFVNGAVDPRDDRPIQASDLPARR
jgi:hypothetical protein